MIRSDDRLSQMMDVIQANPGIQFRELMKKTGMKNGVLSHYIKKVEKTGRVQVERNPRQTRFFPLNISDEEQKIATALRKETPRKIILFLMSEKYQGAEFSEIPEKIGKSPSTTSIYLSQLVDEEIVSIKTDNRRKFYIINNRMLIDQFIDLYCPGVIERAADSFADTFNSF